MTSPRFPLGLLAVSLAATATATAPPQLTEPLPVDSVPVLNDPISIGHGDIDGDGLLDVAVYSRDDDRPLWFRNLGSGTFSEAREFLPGTTGGESMQLVDFDGNGTLDLVSWRSFGTAGQMTWASNQGGGDFVEEVSVLTPGIVPRGVLSRDWNNDGAMDLLVQDSGRVYAYLGNGSNASLSGQLAADYLGREVGSFTFGDVNGDGLEDLVFQVQADFNTMAPATIAIHLQSVGGGFGAGVELTFPELFANMILALPLGLTDLDGDGDNDIVQVGRSLLSLTNDSGTFTTPPATMVALGGPPTDAQFVDLDGDSDLDLAVDTWPAGGMPRTISEFTNSGTGALMLTQEHSPGINPHHIDAVDFNGDGLLDYAVSNGFGNNLYFYRRTTASTFAAPLRINHQASVGNFELADVNGDGRMDVVDITDALDFHEQLPGGDFGPRVSVAFNGTRTPWGPPVIADVNGDEFPDAVLATFFAVSNFSAFLGGASGFQGGTTLVEEPNSDAHFGPYSVDLNSDGTPDLLFPAYGRDKITGILSNGSGGWSALTDLADVAQPSAIHIFDMDGDGREDVLVTSDGTWPSAQLFALRNLGGTQGLGTPVPINGPMDAIQGVASMDVDEDGDLDIVHLREVGSTTELVWHAHITALAYASPQEVSPSAGSGLTEELVVVDWNLDGLEDILLWTGFRRLEWIRNLGSGQFAPREILRPAVDAKGLKVVDLDGDSDFDVVYFERRQNQIVYLENQSTIGTKYCDGIPNSVNAVATLTVSGSSTAEVNRLALRSTDLPQNAFGYYLLSETRDFVANPNGSQGNLCLGGSVGRYNRASEILFSGESGTIELRPDLADTPQPTGSVAVQSGQTWCFQAWYRDANPGLTSNFTDAVEVVFD